MTSSKNGWLRPDTTHVPENYGFNAIKLYGGDVKNEWLNLNSVKVEGGKTITADFRALAKERTAGYRYGLVAVTTDDQCVYGRVQSAPKGKAALTLPAGKAVKAVYLLVMGAPTTHTQDPSSRRFPYEVRVR